MSTVFQAPSPGRVVFVVLDSMRTRCALVTNVMNDDLYSVDLNIQLCPSDPEYYNREEGVVEPVIAKGNVRYDPTCAVGTWHWPPRV